MRKRKEKFAAQEKTDEELQGFAKLKHIKNLESIQAAKAKSCPSQSGGLWTDEDLGELIRLVKKYPGGTPARWETIAESMNRTVTEITFMAAKMKEQGFRLPGQPANADSVAESIVQETIKVIPKLEYIHIEISYIVFFFTLSLKPNNPSPSFYPKPIGRRSSSVCSKRP